MARLALIYDLLEAAYREDLLQYKRHNRKLRDINNPFDICEDTFQSIYRLNHSAFEGLCEDIVPLLKKPSRISEMSRSCKILTALNFYASGSYQRSVGQNSNMSQQSASRAIKQVTEALNTPHIVAKYIRFPQNRTERSEIQQRYLQKFQMPGVVGCVDGTHVAIVRPRDNEENFFNRKYYNSLNVQVICDSDLNITSVDPSYGGAAHDSHIWNNHPIKKHLTELAANGEESWLLGDSGYAVHNSMMTPIFDAQPGTPEELYNEKHKLARDTVAQTIEMLKSRWRCLLASRELYYEPATAARIVNACCVLHNLCNRYRLPYRGLTQEQLIIEHRLQEYAEPGKPRLPEGPTQGRDMLEGKETRSRLVRNMWASCGT